MPFTLTGEKSVVVTDCGTFYFGRNSGDGNRGHLYDVEGNSLGAVSEPDNYASARHFCIIVKRPRLLDRLLYSRHRRRYLIRDLNSSNGTFVNGQRIKKMDLESGTHQVGNSVNLVTLKIS